MSAAPVRLRRGRPQDTFSIAQVRYVISATTISATTISATAISASPKVYPRLGKTPHQGSVSRRG